MKLLENLRMNRNPLRHLCNVLERQEADYVMEQQRFCSTRTMEQQSTCSTRTQQMYHNSVTNTVVRPCHTHLFIMCGEQQLDSISTTSNSSSSSMLRTHTLF